MAALLFLTVYIGFYQLPFVWIPVLIPGAWAAGKGGSRLSTGEDWMMKVLVMAGAGLHKPAAAER